MEEDGRSVEFGDADSLSVATMRVQNDFFWIRLAVFSALGFGEAYMYGEVAVDRLAELFQVAL